MNTRFFRSFWFRAASTLVLLALILLYVNPVEAARTFSDADPLWLGLAILISVPLMATKIMRWGLLVHLEIPATWQDITTSYLMGLALSIFTPGGAGEVGRAAFLSRQSGDGHLASLSGKAVLDKFVDLYVLLVFSGIGLLLTGRLGLQALGILLLLGTAIGSLVALRLRKMVFFQRLKIIQKVINGMTGTPLQVLAYNLLLAMGGFIILYFQLYVLLRAFGANVPLESIIYYPLITLSTLLPITVSGIGVREWTAVVLLEPYNLETSLVFNAVFVHFLVASVLPALVGGILWWTRPQNTPTDETPNPASTPTVS